MNQGIPTAAQFRAYSESMRELLFESDKEFSIGLSFPIEQDGTPSQELLNTAAQYANFRVSRFTQNSDDLNAVNSFWNRDAAFQFALKKAGFQEPTDLKHAVLSTAERYNNVWFRRGYKELEFRRIKDSHEQVNRWLLALSLLAARYLDGTLIRGALEAKEKVSAAALHINELAKLFESDGFSYFLDKLPRSTLFTSRMFESLKRDLEAVNMLLAEPATSNYISVRNDQFLTARIIAEQILIANKYAFKCQKRPERKDLAYILMGMGFFNGDYSIEPKTIERVWDQLDTKGYSLFFASLDAKNLRGDRIRGKKGAIYDPRI